MERCKISTSASPLCERLSYSELGCGPGFFLQYLQKRGYTNAEGVDLSAEQTAIAVRNGMNAQAGDVFESLKNLHGKYDIIIAFDLLEHFTKDELLILSKLVFSALRPGGMFLIHTPNADGFLPGRSLYGDLTHVTLLNQNSLVQLFSFAGFDRYEFQEAGAAPVNLKGAFRFISWKILRFFINAMKTIEFGEGYPILTHNIIAAAYKT
jgi:SAM-dependent methyltransferase